jgi:hypothetical protein
MLEMVLPRHRRASVAAGCDAAALTAFVIVGLLSHTGSIPLGGLAATLIPLLASWMAAAASVGLYSYPRPAALLVTWLVGVPLGVAIRAVVLDRPANTEEAAFLAASRVFTLLFVCVARAALQRADRRRISSRGARAESD